MDLGELFVCGMKSVLFSLLLILFRKLARVERFCPNETTIVIDWRILPLLPLTIGPNDRKSIDFRRFVQAENVARIAGR